MQSIKILLLMSCILFWGCFGSRQEVDKQSVNENRSKFFESSHSWDLLDDESTQFLFNVRFKNEDLEWRKEKGVFYVHFFDSIAYLLSLPLDSSEADIYILYSIESEGLVGQEDISFDNCMERNIEERIARVHELCHKKVPMQQTLIAKMKSFLMDDKLSIRSTGCALRLNMLIFNDENRHYFNMVKPSCIEDNMKKDPRIPEYIDFYNEMSAFIKQDFSSCRWDNFGNKEKMIRECGKYNWRWRERYPHLAK